ncbi:isoleucyl-tRNA synthetase [Neisseria gonorrhoeae]|uniref:Isoleucyl-tRNA synthetase n=1 Tax=Neisseria gonorrhoeae TaxID=485 RepID=A0A378W021_NEIGO|nr:isoleucyl-tRNA synthetase [Neisseria gonorrhoeae]
MDGNPRSARSSNRRHRAFARRQTVGSSLQAEAEITAPEEMAGYLNALGEELRFALLVSKAEVKVGDELAVAAKASDGENANAAGITPAMWARLQVMKPSANAVRRMSAEKAKRAITPDKV